jgi:hypothetical protein
VRKDPTHGRRYEIGSTLELSIRAKDVATQATSLGCIPNSGSRVTSSRRQLTSES